MYKTAPFDHGLMMFEWHISSIVLILMGIFGGYGKENFFLITGILSVGLSLMILLINRWSCSKRVVFFPADLAIKINPFKIVLGLGGFACVGIAVMVWPLILRTTDLTFFAAIAGALVCLFGLLIVDDCFI